MDRRRMDADRGCVIQRGRRDAKLAVFVAVQNVLVAACLVVTLYVYFDVHGRKLTSGDNVHIQFEPISGISKNETLKFIVHSSEMMSLQGKDILTRCQGPYILYVYVCYNITEEGKAEGKAKGMLQLQVAGTQTPAVIHFTMNSTDKDCKGLHSIAYLRKGDKAHLHFYTDNLKIEKMTVGLNYLLRECDF